MCPSHSVKYGRNATSKGPQEQMMISIYCYITALKKETDVQHNIDENLSKIGFLNLNIISPKLKQFKKQS